MTWLFDGYMALGVLGVIGMLVLALGQEVIPAVLRFIADAAQPTLVATQIPPPMATSNSSTLTVLR